jgi:metal-responsive CopG/Arc/MetJ family transcriptional regulator
MARKGYTTIALPDELVKEMDSIIKSKKKGYTSRGEFVKEALRSLLKQVKK